MSYYIPLGFKAVNFPKDAYEFVHKFAKKLASPTCAQKHLERVLPYFAEQAWIPSGWAHRSGQNELLREWLYHAFQVNAIYWPQFNLVAIRGSQWPEELAGMLDLSQAFQNATDQDYPLESWGAGCALFDRERATVLTMTDQEVAAASDIDPDETDYGYARRTLLYRRIFAKLQLDKVLEGEDGEFEYISASGLCTSEKHFELLTRAKSILKGLPEPEEVRT